MVNKWLETYCYDITFTATSSFMRLEQSSDIGLNS